MVIIGAKGFAKELLSTITWNGDDSGDLFFFDNLSKDIPNFLYDKYPVIRSWEDLKSHFEAHSPEFILGIGGSRKRFDLASQAVEAGGKLRSIISKQALIGPFGNSIGTGVSILAGSTLSCDINIGNGTLVNKNVNIGHDSTIGKYCELSPGVRILGRTTIGSFTEIGANAVILPDVTIGENCIVGAGAIVNKDYPANTLITGTPARGFPKDFIITK